jgi:hypothetical protein
VKDIMYLAKRGVDVTAVSTDSHDRAERAKTEWDLDRLRLGYDFSIANARE